MLLRGKRKAVCAAVALLLLFACTHTASAIDVSYTLAPLSMSIKLPGNDLVLTRQTETNSPFYEKLALDAAQTQKKMQEEDLYLMGFPTDTAYEIDVRMVKTAQSKEIHNLKFLSETQRKAFTEKLLAEQGSTDSSLTETQQAVFVEFETRTTLQSAEKTHTVTASTIVNGQQITCMLTSVGDDISVEEFGIFHNMVSSIKFTTLLEKPLTVNIGAILLITLAVIVVLAAVAALLIFFRTQKRIRAKGEASFAAQPRSKKISPVDDFYDELEKDGLLNQAPPAQNITVDVVKNEPQDKVFKNKPVRVELEISKEPTENEQAPPQAAPEEEKDSIELSRSNNEDYDEAPYEDAVQHSGKVRIFVGGAGSKIKNSVSSIGGVLKYKPDLSAKEKEAAQRPVVPAKEKKAVQKQAKAVPQQPTAKKTPVVQQKKEQPAPLTHTGAKERRTFDELARNDEILSSFENDRYWDKYKE